MKKQQLLEELRSIREYAASKHAESFEKMSANSVDAKNGVALKAFDDGFQNGINYGFTIAYFHLEHSIQDLINDIEAGVK